MNTRRRAISTFLAFTALATTAACSTPDPEPTPTLTQPPTVMADPTITWIGDNAPSSPLETDPAVQAARAAEIGRAMAFNTGDFTIAQLTDNAGPRVIDYLADAYTKQGDKPWTFPGPNPWEPVAIAETSEGTVIKICRVPYISSIGRTPDPTQAAGPYDLSKASTEEIVVREVSGNPKVVTYHNWGSEWCDGRSVPIGLFDPAPVAPNGPVTEPVRPPEGWTQGKPRD